MTVHDTVPSRQDVGQPATVAGRARGLRRRLARERVQGWFLAGPALILLTGFLIIPFILGFVLAFTNARLLSPNEPEFVGGRNFAELLTVRPLVLDPIGGDDEALDYPAVRDFTRGNADHPELDGLQEWTSFGWGDRKVVLLAGNAVFMRALVNTMMFAAVIAPLQGGLGLLLAVLVNKRVRGTTLFRTVFFMPVVTSMVVVAILWSFIYRGGEDGLANQAVHLLSFGTAGPVDWLGNPSTALPAIIVLSIWQAVGFHMVIWLSGLQTIPGELYEAASIDGATAWQQFKHITWPGLRHTAVFVLITITIAAFGLFTQIDVMTSGGPLDATQTVVYRAVQEGFVQQDLGLGSAISVVFFVLVLVIALVQRFLTREKA